MDALAPTVGRAEPPDTSWVSALIEARQTILPKRLAAPGPDAAQLRQILAAAAHAPDHDRKRPWRFILVPQAQRTRLAEAFAQALLERDAGATASQVEQAREKAFRAPLVMLAVVRLQPPGDDIPDTERILSAGCAIQNMLLVATAQGWGSALTSGKAVRSNALRDLFRLDAHEEALCFLSIGTPSVGKRGSARPQPEDYVSELEDVP